MSGLSVTLPLLFLFFFLLGVDRWWRRERTRQRRWDEHVASLRRPWTPEEESAANRALLNSVRDRQRGRR